MIKALAVCDFCKKKIGEDLPMVSGLVSDPSYVYLQKRQGETITQYGICEDCNKKVLALIQPDPPPAPAAPKKA